MPMPILRFLRLIIPFGFPFYVYAYAYVYINERFTK